MERKLASIQKILALDPIDGADAIVKATILGWSLVVKKDEFKVGDLCVYIETDSILPDRPEFAFLAPSFRIKTRKFRKQVSQGIAFPLSILPQHIYEQMKDADPTELLGKDVTEMLDIRKYEPYIPAQLQGLIKGSFPAFLHKTDEMRIQAVPDVLARHEGTLFFITEKLDGTSFTAYLRDGEFGVCSRNLELKESEDNTYWKIAKQLDLKSRLERLGGNFAIQGELIGQGIQKNKYELSTQELRLFNVFDISKGQYLRYDDFLTAAKVLELETVPVVSILALKHSIPELVELSKGYSALNKKTLREGLIWRPLVETYDADLGRLSFKVINPDFLLKYDDE